MPQKKKISKAAKVRVKRDEEIEDKRNDNELEDEKNNNKIEYRRDDYELENKNDNDELGDDDDELEDDYNNELEDKDEDDEIKDKDDDELEHKDDDKLEDKDDDDIGNENEFENDNFNSKLIKLEEILSGNLKKMMAYDYLHYRTVYMFFKKWKYDNLNKEQASLHSTKEYHQKIKSIIDDEDVIEQSLLFIREKGGKTTPKEYQTFVKEELFSHLGLVSQSRKKGIYFDGHEREDVIKYRKEFLDKMLIYEMFMPTFEEENMEQKDPILLPNEKLHIFITYDEYLFYVNDDRPIVWAPIDEPLLRKKGQGKSIMISDFLLETNRRLKLNENEILLYPEIPIEARKFLTPGKNEEGW
ncbi:hypothetical protein C1645_734360 [Glomus cerebriforme]|uniref:Uncharacterized protein n=1 Tax=Glomus cerebriforme TaxID=658196 RepID=A0A397TDF6_9GLOM|nr:hypothetical protein C1645_734360 [Glomus cerebriforme]